MCTRCDWDRELKYSAGNWENAGVWGYGKIELLYPLQPRFYRGLEPFIGNGSQSVTKLKRRLGVKKSVNLNIRYVELIISTNSEEFQILF